MTFNFVNDIKKANLFLPNRIISSMIRCAEVPNNYTVESIMLKQGKELSNGIIMDTKQLMFIQSTTEYFN